MDGRAFTLRSIRKAALLLLALFCTALSLAESKPKAIFYYVPAEDAWNSLLNHAAQIPIVAPQVFLVDETGTIHGSVEARVQKLAERQGIGIMPLLASEKPEAARAVLKDEASRRKVIGDALHRCLAIRCVGLQIDLEAVGLEEGRLFSDFVREAARVFHSRRLLLSVAVPTPLLQPSPGETYAEMFGGFAVMPEPYDLKEISRSADFITLMTYGQFGVGTPAGPVAGYHWVEQSLRYALQFVPAKKLSMGLGFWAYRWRNEQVTYSGYQEVDNLAASKGAAYQWHAWHRSPWFEFTQDGDRIVVWFENERSLREKLKLVRQFRLHGFSAWRLGQEDQRFWKKGDETAAGGTAPGR